jgi:type VI secretion system secreted protein VgrG
VAFLPATREVLKIKTSSSEFMVLSMQGHEHLGTPFVYTVELVGALDMLDEPKDVDLQELLGTRATVTMDAHDDPRYFNGYIAQMKRGERRGRYVTYTAVLRPWLWFLTRTRDSRVFQNLSVKDIVTKVLADYSTDSEWRLISASVYPKLDYCVQHDETDFNFVSRLLEEAGIYYFFDHTEDNHTMVLIDSMAKHKSRPSKAEITWANAMKSATTMLNWQHTEEARSAKALVSDRDYLAPSTKIEADARAAKPPSKVGKMEWFEHPANVVQNSQKPDAQSASSAATQKARVLMEELVSLYATATGTTNARDLGVGMTFELKGHPTDDENQHYLAVAINYRLEFGDYEAIDELKSGRPPEGAVCDLLAISMSAPNYRPERTTPRPVIHGPQTAVVVGASGNEIETDKHGRVKVQFHWDRLGKKDENSSCWVRVAHPWAGKGFGMVALPRVGHEVVVSFLDGNPDRPLITGSVYNGENVPPYELPKLATVSGLKTRSSKEGTADTANELRFEDAKDKEYLWFQAQKDYFRLVKKNAFDMVGENETIKVKLTRNEVIGENWYLDVGKDVMHNLGKDLHVNVAADIFYTGGATIQLKIAKDMSVNVGGDAGVEVGGKTALKSSGDIAVQSGTGKLSLKAAADLLAEGMSVKIKGSTTIALESGATITLKAGASFVSIGPSGVDIVGAMVNINSGGSGGSADAAPEAKPKAPEEAKKQDDLTPAKASDYDKKFEDPIPKQ